MTKKTAAPLSGGVPWKGRRQRGRPEFLDKFVIAAAVLLCVLALFLGLKRVAQQVSEGRASRQAPQPLEPKVPPLPEGRLREPSPTQQAVSRVPGLETHPGKRVRKTMAVPVPD